MKFIKQTGLSFLVALLFVSCQDDSNDENGAAYFGGEVINPRNNVVILSKSNRVLDTIQLDKNNRFLYKIDNVEKGLYTFRVSAAEGLEYQMVLLEPSDSIMFRLNTLEFDESLVYTGKGAKKNNYLINLFLDGEMEDKTILGYSQLPPKEFEIRIDSIRDYKLRELKKFNIENPSSEIFNNLVKGNINYDYYLSKEIYPFVNYSNTERENFDALPDNFYSYRKDVDYNYCELMDYFPYYSFLKHHFENMALSEHFKISSDNVFDIKSLDYNLIRLKLIDSLVVNDSIKNDLLVRTTVEFISNSKNIDEYDALLKSYSSKNTSAKNEKYVTSIVNSLKGLKPGNKLPLVEVIDFKNHTIPLQAVIKRPTVLYFWSSSYRSHIDSHKKASELKVKYPEINFIAINANIDNEKLWKKVVAQYNYDKENEYLFKDPTHAKHMLAVYPINKVMIVNRKGAIVNAHTNMFSIMFEEELLGLLNQ